MLSIRAVLRSHEFGHRIWQWGEGGSLNCAAREDCAGGRTVLWTLSKGLEIEVSDFEAEHTTLKGDY
jgi:hypothetical protein